MCSSHDPSTPEESEFLRTQYQLVVESADRYQAQHLLVNRFFITLILALLVVGGSLSAVSTPSSDPSWEVVGRVAALMIIVVLCIPWLEYEQSFYIKRLIKSYLIRQLEQSEVYPSLYKPFSAEYQLRRYKIHKDKFSSPPKGLRKQSINLATLWPFIIAIFSLLFLFFLYDLELQSLLDIPNFTVILGFKVCFLIFIVRFVVISINQAKVARLLDADPKIEDLITKARDEGGDLET